MTLRGTPAAPSSRRRVSTWPRDPVPPVMTTVLFSKRFMPLLPCVVLRRPSRRPRPLPVGRAREEVAVHPLDHLGPRRRLVAGRAPEPAPVERPVAAERLLPLD